MLSVALLHLPPPHLAQVGTAATAASKAMSPCVRFLTSDM